MFGSNSPVSIDHPTGQTNFTEIRLGPIDLFFSYSTVVAFAAPGIGRVVSENVWSQTTGRHLNFIDGGAKSSRLAHEAFEEMLGKLLDQIEFHHPYPHELER